MAFWNRRVLSDLSKEGKEERTELNELKEASQILNEMLEKMRGWNTGSFTPELRRSVVELNDRAMFLITTAKSHDAKVRECSEKVRSELVEDRRKNMIMPPGASELDEEERRVFRMTTQLAETLDSLIELLRYSKRWLLSTDDQAADEHAHLNFTSAAYQTDRIINRISYVFEQERKISERNRDTRTIQRARKYFEKSMY